MSNGATQMNEGYHHQQHLGNDDDDDDDDDWFPYSPVMTVLVKTMVLALYLMMKLHHL